MRIVTTDTIVDRRIVRTIGVAWGVSPHALSPWDEGVKSLATGRTVPPAELARLMWAARADALAELADVALEMGANAVVGVRFTGRQVTGMWMEVCAYGTAVVVSPDDDDNAHPLAS